MTKSKKRWLKKRAKEELERQKEVQRKLDNERAFREFQAEITQAFNKKDCEVFNWRYDGF